MLKQAQWRSRHSKEIKFAMFLVGFIEALAGMFMLAN